jgi:hypothetical protein
MPIVSSSLQTGKIVSFVSAEEFYSLIKAPFTWDQDEVKSEWKLKLSTCLPWDQYENHKIFNLFPLPVFFLVDGFC